MISAKVIADSINPDDRRLITLEITFQRWILAEVNTHRMLSRNSASSRAIPTKKMLWNVLRDPAIPVSWGRNQAGMKARTELTGVRRWLASKLFSLARFPAVVVAWMLSKIGLHKQITNRIVEPWMWHTAIVSATDWDNLLKLRAHADAQPEFRILAECIKAAMAESKPTAIGWGEWHMPYTDSNDDVDKPSLVPADWDRKIPIRAWISCARCARVSYVRQNAKRDPVSDIAMSTQLRDSGHWSPFEHQAQAVKGYVGGNFTGGWQQLRKFYPGEDGNGK